MFQSWKNEPADVTVQIQTYSFAQILAFFYFHQIQTIQIPHPKNGCKLFWESKFFSKI